MIAVTEKDVFNAFNRSIKKSGSQNKLSQETGVPQSTINDICNGNKKIGNITLTNFLKLFPSMKIDFFGKNLPDDYISEIIRLLGTLTSQEQKEIHDAIIACYPDSVGDNKLKTKLIQE